MARIVGAFGLTLLIVTAAVPPAAAQPIGTFRWQFQPFCNVVTLAVTGTPAGFRMEGTDDQCGVTPASAIGMAYPKAGGTVGFGLTLVFATGISLHVDGTIDPAAGFFGSWFDSVGRAGTLAFTPGAGTGGPLRPVVAPVVTYGSTVDQPPSGGDRGLSVRVSTDTGGPSDAAAIFGQFGGATGFPTPGSAGVRGDSADVVGVMGTTNSGLGVAGVAGSGGTALQGHAVGANSVAVRATHADGGIALDINNGLIRVSGTARSAFTFISPASNQCYGNDHPRLTGNPNALVFVSPQRYGYTGGAGYSAAANQWLICVLSPAGFTGPVPVSVLVIEQ